MDLPREYQLSPGTVLYRFVQVTPERPAIMGADGPWWLESEHFMKLNHFALANGLPLSHVAQSLVSIHAEWPEVNGFVRAEVIRSLKCWKGRGKQVVSSVKKKSRAKVAETGSGPEVSQVFIPGIGGVSSLFLTAFTYLDCTSIQSVSR
jgi:hypothetical protein